MPKAKGKGKAKGKSQAKGKGKGKSPAPKKLTKKQVNEFLELLVSEEGPQYEEAELLATTDGFHVIEGAYDTENGDFSLIFLAEDGTEVHIVAIDHDKDQDEWSAYKGKKIEDTHELYIEGQSTGKGFPIEFDYEVSEEDGDSEEAEGEDDGGEDDGGEAIDFDEMDLKELQIFAIENDLEVTITKKTKLAKARKDVAAAWAELQAEADEDTGDEPGEVEGAPENLASLLARSAYSLGNLKSLASGLVAIDTANELLACRPWFEACSEALDGDKAFKPVLKALDEAESLVEVFEGVDIEAAAKALQSFNKAFEALDKALDAYPAEEGEED